MMHSESSSHPHSYEKRENREQAREREAVHQKARRIQREHKAATKVAAKAKKGVEEEERRRLRAGRVERMRTLHENRSTRRAVARLRVQSTFPAPSHK